jgi:hypothetical protein
MCDLGQSNHLRRVETPFLCWDRQEREECRTAKVHIGPMVREGKKKVRKRKPQVFFSAAPFQLAHYPSLAQPLRMWTAPFGCGYAALWSTPELFDVLLQRSFQQGGVGRSLFAYLITRYDLVLRFLN